MSTVTTSVRHSVANHWIISAIAVAVLATALVVSLVAAFGGSSSGNTSNGTSLTGGPRCTTSGLSSAFC